MGKTNAIILSLTLLCGITLFTSAVHASGNREKEAEELSTLSSISVSPKIKLKISGVEDRKIEVITVSERSDSYSIGVMLCPQSLQESSNEWGTKIQGIYDSNNLSLRYIDEGKFWQIPHITLCIFKNVKFANIENFQGIFQVLENASVKFKAASFEFMGKGDVLVTLPDFSNIERLKELNVSTINYIEESEFFPLDQGDYQIDRNTKKGKFKPHMSLNTSVAYQQRKKVRASLLNNMESLNLDLNYVVITATNEW